MWEEGGKKTARDVRQHATGLGSATQTVEEKRSTRGIIRFTGAVKQWPPSVDLARPRMCPECGQPAFEGGRVRIYGHGLVGRQQRGPPGPEQAPATEVLLCRRYLCTGCRAVLTVLPASAQARKHFSGAAIALALTLWGLCGYSAARVRELVSDWVYTGAAARGWRSLARWAAQVAGGELFVALGVRAQGSPQEVAARAAQALCGTCPPEVRSQSLPHQAFAGAHHVS